MRVRALSTASCTDGRMKPALISGGPLADCWWSGSEPRYWRGSYQVMLLVTSTSQTRGSIKEISCWSIEQIIANLRCALKPDQLGLSSEWTCSSRETVYLNIFETNDEDVCVFGCSWLSTVKQDERESNSSSRLRHLGLLRLTDQVSIHPSVALVSLVSFSVAGPWQITSNAYISSIITVEHWNANMLMLVNACISSFIKCDWWIW